MDEAFHSQDFSPLGGKTLLVWKTALVQARRFSAPPARRAIGEAVSQVSSALARKNADELGVTRYENAIIGASVKYSDALACIFDFELKIDLSDPDDDPSTPGGAVAATFRRLDPAVSQKNVLASYCHELGAFPKSVLGVLITLFSIIVGSSRVKTFLFASRDFWRWDCGRPLLAILRASTKTPGSLITTLNVEIRPSRFHSHEGVATSGNAIATLRKLLSRVSMKYLFFSSCGLAVLGRASHVHSRREFIPDRIRLDEAIRGSSHDDVAQLVGIDRKADSAMPEDGCRAGHWACAFTCACASATGRIRASLERVAAGVRYTTRQVGMFQSHPGIETAGVARGRGLARA
jgi:hypothetical protein